MTNIISTQGFIIHDQVVDQANHMELIFWIKTPEDVVKVIISNERPLFFIESDANLNLSFQGERKKLNLKAFNGRSLDGIYFNRHKDLMDTREHFHKNGIRTYESDVRPNERFLMERFINGEVLIQGQAQVMGKMRVFHNPQMKALGIHESAQKPTPNFNIMSLDIETSMGNDLYSIAIHQIGDRDIKKVYMVDESGQYSNDELTTFYRSEKELMISFINDFPNYDPDFIVGWHVIGFDLKFLERKCQQFGIKFNLGRDGSQVRLRERKGAGWFSTIAGRQVIDGPPTLRAAFYQFENFKLDTVATAVLGANKDITETGMDKVEEITRRFLEEKHALAKYNILDCTLVLDIYKKLEIIDHLYRRVQLSGMLIDRLSGSTRAFDHIYLPRLHRKGFIAGNTLDIDKESASLGGLVIEGTKGLHENVVVLDFKSLYPTIIKTFKIDPLSRLKGDVNSTVLKNGVAFSKTEHILPEQIDFLLKQREIAKTRQDKNLSQAVKILMNSFYGVMGSGGCRFYHADLATSITSTGQWLLNESMNYARSLGYEVVYGDTDSVFIKLKFLETSQKDKAGTDLARKITTHLTELIERDYDLESHLEMEYEKCFKKLFIPESRSSEMGAKKRYAGIFDNGELYFSGMEFVRSDWTKAAKSFQYEIYKRFFNAESLNEYIKNYVNDLKNGLFDKELIYSKRLSKDISEYTKSNPPHVKAARLLQEKEPDKNIRKIDYLITMHGPVPLDFAPKDIDYQHYIDKQLSPVATDVLKFMGISFDDIVMGSQMSLFE
ncbi:DNA polymerase II [Halobacteriovorax sp. HFRX-2_2]|uniref:DNA polymerase II n=1 Tax=unclassified Halobacteriovorax TaxID=2639665 RepID=UPI0037109FB7